MRLRPTIIPRQELELAGRSQTSLDASLQEYPKD